MLGFQSFDNIPYEELSHEKGSNQMSEAQWVVEGVLGEKVTHAIAELHLPYPHVSLHQVAAVAQSLHLSSFVHIRH